MRVHIGRSRSHCLGLWRRVDRAGYGRIAKSRRRVLQHRTLRRSVLGGRSRRRTRRRQHLENGHWGRDRQHFSIGRRNWRPQTSQTFRRRLCHRRLGWLGLAESNWFGLDRGLDLFEAPQQPLQLIKLWLLLSHSSLVHRIIAGSADGLSHVTRSPPMAHNRGEAYQGSFRDFASAAPTAAQLRVHQSPFS